MGPYRMSGSSPGRNGERGHPRQKELQVQGQRSVQVHAAFREQQNWTYSLTGKLKLGYERFHMLAEETTRSSTERGDSYGLKTKGVMMATRLFDS